MRVLAAAAVFLAGLAPVFGQCNPCAKASFGPAAEYVAGPVGIFVDFDGDGHLDSLTWQGASVRLARGTGTGHFGAPAVLFQAALDYGEAISSVVAGDFNNDGIPDLALAHPGNGGEGGVLVVLGKGSGVVGNPIATPGGHAQILAAADFDGDGKLDIAALSLRDGVATVRFGRGDGTFEASVFLALASGTSIVAGDFDGDGRPDVAIARPSYPLPAGVSVFVHASARAFASPILIARKEARSLAAADLDNDGRMDLMVDGVVYLSRAGGTFETPLGDASAYPGTLLADFNGDGFLDLAAGTDQGIDLYLGDGSGTFGGLVSSVGMAFPLVVAADVNEDGLPDAVGTGGIALARRDGTFAIAPSPTKGFQARGLARADFTGDGVPDLVFAAGYDRGVQVLPGRPDGTFAPAVRIVSTPAFSLVVGDFNGDGRADLAISALYGLEVRLGLPGGGVSSPSTVSQSNSLPSGIGDFRGNGLSDLVFLQYGKVAVRTSNGDGTFGSEITTNVSTTASRLLVSDLNGDGRADLILSDSAGISTYLGDGTGRFVLKSTKPVYSTLRAAVDVNGDARPDVIATDSSAALKVIRNDGTGGLLDPITTPLQTDYNEPFAIAGQDFNRDGSMDLALQLYGRALILMGDGTGRFTESSSYWVGMTPQYPSLLAPDLDGDGKADLIGISGSYGDFLWTIRNTGCEARRLGVTREPASCGPPGTPFSSQPLVRVYDDADNLVSCPAAAISAALAAGNGNSAGVLTGTTTVAVSGGAAQFTDLGISLPGAGYRIDFTHSAGPKARSRGISVSPPPPVIVATGACWPGTARLETPEDADYYSWTVDGSVLGTLRSVSVTNLSAGTHSVSLAVMRDGCTRINSQPLVITSAPPTPTATSNSPVPFGQTLKLLASLTPGGTYEWTGPNGFTARDANLSIDGATPRSSGVYRVRIRWGSCLSAEASVSVTVLPAPLCSGCSAASFAAARPLPAGSSTAVVAGDFNGDGVPDIVAGGYGLTTLLGAGAGSFAAPIATPVGAMNSLLAADFDRDGALDVLSVQSNSFSVSLGRGDGSFEPPAVYSTSSLLGAAVGDFNGDGWPDVAAAESSTGKVRIYYGTSSGALAAGPVLALSGGAVAIVAGASRAGGRQDLVVAQSSPSAIVTFVWSQDGSVAAGAWLPSVSGAPMILADLDGDGIPDLVLKVSTSAVLLCRGNSDGSFTVRQEVPVPNFQRVRVADLDADGRPDLVLAGSTDSAVSVLYGKGSWTYGPLVSLPAGLNPQDLAIEDFDGDGRRDVAVLGGSASGNVVEVLFNGNAGFQFAPLYSLGAPAGPAVIGDFNGDGFPDLAIRRKDSYSYGPLSIFFNDKRGGFLAAAPLDLTSPAISVGSADFNGDGRADLAIESNGNVYIYLGSSGMPVLQQTITGLSASSLAVADFTGDGKPDLAVVTGTGIVVLAGDGKGVFSTSGPVSGPPQASSIIVGDFNGDGKPDLFVFQNVSPYIALAYANGDGTFRPGAPVSFPAYNVTVGDFNGDGKDDLACTNGPDQGVTVLLSNGEGFAPAVVTKLPYWASSIGVADFNGDGQDDLVAVGASDGSATVLLSNGAGGFLPKTDFLVGRSPGFAFAGDFDADGKADFGTVDAYDGKVSIALGTRCVPRRLLAQPLVSCAAPGATLPAQTVKVLDDGGNVIACAGGEITAFLKEATSSGTALLGTRSSPVSGGSASFSDLSIDRPGKGYRIEFRHPVAGPVLTAPFSIGAAPPAPVAGNDGPVCARGSLHLTASFIPGATYRWTGPNGFVSSHRNPVLSDATAAASGVYSVTATVDGCPSEAAMTAVTVNFVPAPTVLGSISVCAGKPIQLTASTVPGASYRWTGPGGFQSTEQNPRIDSATNASAGLYTVTAIVGSCESLSATTSVTVKPLPSTAITTVAAVCPGRDLYTASVSPTENGYTWTIVNGTITGGVGTSSITFRAGSSGTVTLTVVVAGRYGCSAQSSVDLPVTACSAEPAGLSVDGSPGGLSDGDGVLEPGETALVSPSWKNVGNAPMPLSGAVTSFTGPFGAVYTIVDAAADFGTVAPNGIASCSGTANCYSLSVSNPTPRPASHWDAVFQEKLSNGDPPTNRSIHIGKSFQDVPTSHVFYTTIETLFHTGITTGCTTTTYCPDSAVSRLQMSVFLARALAGADTLIPAAGVAQGKSYNCSSSGNSLFADVDRIDPFCRHVHYIYANGITTGCEPGKFCPNPTVTRGQMAMFVARALRGTDANVPTSYGPDPATGRRYSCDPANPELHFSDVFLTDAYCRHTHYLWATDVISGYADGTFVPSLGLTRGSMAKFLVNGFRLRLYGP